VLDGVELPVRANIGIHTSRFRSSASGGRVPVPLQPMPIGVQIIAAPWREDIALRVASALERAGVVSAARHEDYEWKSIADVLAEVTGQSRATRRRWSETTSRCSTSCSAPMPHPALRDRRNLYGHDAITAFRAARSPAGLMRRTENTVITTYGRDTAVASTLFIATPLQVELTADADMG